VAQSKYHFPIKGQYHSISDTNIVWLSSVVSASVIVSKVRRGYTQHGTGVPLSCLFSSLVHSLPDLLLWFTFSLFPFLVRFTYFLHLSIPSLSTRIVTTPFPGRRSKEAIERGFSLFRSFCVICIAYLRFILVFYCIWFSLVLWCDSCLPLL